MRAGMKTWVLCGLLASWVGSAEGAGFVLMKGPKVHGRFGYSVEFPKGYTAAKDEGNDGADTVAAWPSKKKVKFSDIMDLKKVEALGIISLHVYPRARFTMDMVDYAEKIKRSAEDRGLGNTWSMQKFPAGKAMVVSIFGDESFTNLLIEGKNSLFVFTASDLSDALVATARTVSEDSKAGLSNLKGKGN